MTIKLLTTLCGPDGNLHPGPHSLDAARERALVDAGCAQYVKQQGKAETARRRAPETAALQHVARESGKE
jgi:hypothetical protein